MSGERAGIRNPQQQPYYEQSPGDDSERAGPTPDQSDSAGAVFPIENRFQESTYRLADLSVLFMESAGEKPSREMLQTEFYFGRPVIRSAVIHRCASQGGRQYAMAWLFEHAEPDLSLHLPACEVTVSANGKVYVSAGCPIDYPLRPQAKTVNHSSGRAAVAAPKAAVRRTHSKRSAGASMPVPLRQRARWVWVPLFLLVILAGGVLAHRDLLAPVSTTSETAAGRPQDEPLTVTAVEQENQIEPELYAGTPEPPSLRQSEEPVQSEGEPAASAPQPATSEPQPTTSAPPPATSEPQPSASERQPATSEPPPAASEPQAAASAQHRALPERSAPASRPRLMERKIAASERRVKRRPDAGRPPPPRSSEAVAAVQAFSSREPTVAAATTAKAPPPVAPDPPIAIGGTPGDGRETTQAVAKEQPVPSVIVREEQPAPAPVVQGQRQQVAVENTWLTRMRAELVVCGKPGFWRNDICREVTRWKYCHPDRWRTVAECAVESFP